MTEATREVVVTGDGVALRQDIACGPNRWSADEPASNGGTDAGPGAHELLLSALCACTRAARRMNWPVR